MTDYAPQQNTHWYRAGGRFSYTADPTQADPGEVARIGLHDCERLGCTRFHRCNSLEYSLWLIRKYFCEEIGEAAVTAGGHRAEGVQGVPRQV